MSKIMYRIYLAHHGAGKKRLGKRLELIQVISNTLLEIMYFLNAFNRAATNQNHYEKFLNVYY